MLVYQRMVFLDLDHGHCRSQYVPFVWQRPQVRGVLEKYLSNERPFAASIQRLGSCLRNNPCGWTDDVGLKMGDGLNIGLILV